MYLFSVFTGPKTTMHIIFPSALALSSGELHNLTVNEFFDFEAAIR